MPTYTNHIPVLTWTISALQVLGFCRKQTNIVSVLSLTSLIFLVFLQLLDVSLNWEGLISLKRIIFMPACFMSTVKGIMLLYRSKQSLKLLEDIKLFWDPVGCDSKTRKNALKIFKIVTILCPFYLAFCIVFCTLLVILPWFNVDRREFVLGHYCFCDKFASFSCWFSMWFWQSILLLGMEVPLTCLFDCIFIICTAYFYNACEILKTAFKELDGTRKNIVLKQIVDQHNVLMNFVKNFDKLFTGFMLVQFWCSLWSLILYLVMIVFDGIPPKTQDVLLFGTLYGIFLFQILAYSLCGTVIEEQLKSLPTALFEINWHGRGRTGLRKDLAFMIFRTQNTNGLSVGKMSALNLTLFVYVIKHSLSVLTLILQLDNEK